MRKTCLLLFVCLSLFAVTAHAQNDRDLKKEAQIWEKLKTVSPQSVDTFKRATEALDSDNLQEAAKLYQEVFIKAPNFDPVMRRLGGVLTEIGRREEGLELLEMAVKKNPSPENQGALAYSLAIQENHNPSAETLMRAFLLAKDAYFKNPDNQDLYYPLIYAQIALQADQDREFRDAVRTLTIYHPDLMQTHYYKAIIAAMDEHWMDAETEIKKAEALGLPRATAAAFLESGIKSRATVWRYAYYSLFLLGAWLVGLVLLFGFGKLMSKKTMNWIETSDPNAEARQSHAALRKWYRRLLNLGGLYYYLSMPFVLFLTVAIAGSIIYAMLVANYVAIKLVFFIGAGALVTIYSMIRSLFIRVEAKDPGRSLSREEAPNLWALTEEVAKSIGTRPIDEIRVTPGTDMAVYERGSFRERLQDRAHRILILGVATLNDFKVKPFRAVLAHEYGHFSHRDTAGGDIAIRVNRDILNFALAMAAQNQAVHWNVAFQFLRVYHFIFRRISHGATRLQEVMADRVAVKTYGAEAFEEGLTHIIRREVEFEDVSYWELTNAAKQSRAVQNLYDLKTVGENIDEKVHEAINRQSSEDDTHPAPIERFRLARRIVSDASLSAEGMVWDLFSDRVALTSEMSQTIERLVRERRYQ